MTTNSEQSPVRLNLYTAATFQRLKREVWTWEKLSHPNITPLLGYRSGDEPLLLTPYYENGNLIQFLKQHPQAPRLKLVRLRTPCFSNVDAQEHNPDQVVGAASGLLYLHHLTPAVVHGDIKPDNVLVNDSREASLCDFGLARFIQEMRTGLTTSGQGQGGKGYIAPELLDCEEYEKKTMESDVYAVGGLILHVRRVTFLPALVIAFAIPLDVLLAMPTHGSSTHNH